MLAVLIVASFVAAEAHSQPAPSNSSGRRAIEAAMERLIRGPAYDARLRQTMWSNGRELIAVGSWLCGGGATGRYRLNVTIHDGAAKHSMTQISDGRLAWTRRQIGSEIQLRRVDLSRLDDWVSPAGGAGNGDSAANGQTWVTAQDDPGSRPSRRVGGVVEMLQDILDQYDLRLRSASLGGHPVTVVTGSLKQSFRDQWTAHGGDNGLSPLQPTRVRVAITADAKSDSNEPSKQNFGPGYPIRLEYWSDPSPSKSDPRSTDDATKTMQTQGRLVSLVELHSMQAIETPPAIEFRYENNDDNVEFQNDTERYLQRYGIRLTDSQRLLLRR